jgi:ankyrin repeat protein
MASLQERLAIMETNPRRRNRGQVPSEVVAAALQYQQAYVHRELAFNTGAISDCSESLEQMRTDKREARENRDMMWEDHYATLINCELVRVMAAKKKKLAQETTTLSQLTSDRDKWNMAIELHMLEYLSASLSAVDLERRKEYFSSYQKSGQMPLHRAFKANDAELVQLLVSLGAELVAMDEAGKVRIECVNWISPPIRCLTCSRLNGQSIFHVMAENRSTALFRTTIARLTDSSRLILLQVDNTGNSVLHAAASSGSDEILQQLLSEPYRSTVGSLIDLQRGTDKATALHLAARNGHLRCLEILMEQGQPNTTLSTIQGSNALHLALHQTFNIDKLSDVFLKHTPEGSREDTFNSFDEHTGQCCLHTAIAKGYLSFSMQLIQEKRVQLNTSTRDGTWSPLHLAVMIGSFKLVTALLSAGAIVDMVDTDGQTPLLLACLGGRLEIVRLLLDSRANPAHQNKQAHSALHYLAAFCRDRQLLEDLVGAGADVNAKSLKLNTPLHFAAMNGNEVAAQVLLAHGASPSVINEDKRSVVYLAKKWRHRGVEDLVKPPERVSDGDTSAGATTPATRGNQRPVTPVGLHRLVPGGRSTGMASRARGAKLLGLDDESDSDSLFAFEDDEPILPSSHPWPVTGGGDVASACHNFTELRERFMDRSANPRSPLAPVVTAHDRRYLGSPPSSPSRSRRATSSEEPLELVRTTRRFLPGPVRVPWELTVPATLPGSEATAQRRLKPSIRTNLGLLRDHLAHAQALHWPAEAGRPPRREISAPATLRS